MKLGPYELPGLYAGDALEGLRALPDGCIHCVVTSPPYWGLRNYEVEGQLGIERTPEAHVRAMVEVFREVRRVLRHDGTLWLNYGDSYTGNGGGKQHRGLLSGKAFAQLPHGTQYKTAPGLPKGSLVGMPWRVALALQADGWLLRADIIWHKRNPVPAPLRRRPTTAHEYVFLFAKSWGYFYDDDAVMEPVTGGAKPRGSGTTPKGEAAPPRVRGNNSVGAALRNPVSKRVQRSVWSLVGEPVHEAHFATFPTALVKPCLLAGTSAHGVCSHCGAPWRRVVEVLDHAGTLGASWHEHDEDLKHGQRGAPPGECAPERVTRGWEPTCTCYQGQGLGWLDHEDLAPAVVLDPFMGSGTTAVVAERLGRAWLGFDVQPDYIEMAQERLGG